MSFPATSAGVELLSPSEVGKILYAAANEADVYLVGGQALNLWAELYASTGCDELALYRPFVSKDVDYFGMVDAAARIASALGGSISVPTADTATPNTAIMTITFGRRQVIIDFLNFIKGLRSRDLARFGSLIVELPVTGGNGSMTNDFIPVPVLHPVLCLQSRVGNVIGLNRTDPRSISQVSTSIIVVREYIHRCLENDNRREASRCIKAVFEYTRSDILGSKVYQKHRIDLMAAIDLEHPQHSAVYRERTLSPMFAEISRRRKAQAR